MATILHMSYIVPRELLVDETRFWWMVGFERVTRPEPKYKGSWLRSDDAYIYLHPGIDKVPEWNHFAFVPRHGYDRALENLQSDEMKTLVEPAEPYWGARRVFAQTPAGYRVELVEFRPPARYTGPPETD